MACVWAVLSGCDAPIAPVDAGALDGSCLTDVVEVGGSGGRFVPLAAVGATLDIVRGPQGGIHLVVGFRIHDLPLDLSATYRLRDAVSGVEAAPPVARILTPGLYRADGPGWVRVDDLLVLDADSPRVEDFAGRTFALELEVVTTTGVCARDSHLVTLR